MPTFEELDINQQLLVAIRKADKPLFALAREAGVEQSSLWRYLNGEADLRLSTAAKVAQVLRLTLVPMNGAGKPKRKGLRK